ncbi:uncharacterized protein LOC130671948 [Microplitis mediator]|uniref:uncharacterized protein LOC130671948 n=1 Tax=Microplitis mediator TaxID=375433 RepID=UPI002554CC7B|nr:uncharacterized protein LOC130671948 [Microplitis mediator]
MAHWWNCVPQHPRAAQLWIISMRRMDVGIPALYILCSHRTAALYNSIFNWILQEAPEVRENLQTIVSDFEVALLSSVQVTIPWVRRRGCWFHFARVRFPANRCQEAIQVIVNLLQPLENFNDNYFLFRRYLQRFWLPQANTVSVCDVPWRTNNVAEAFNRHLLARMGRPHPPLFRFLDENDDLTMVEEV